jgi:hypothetical protein
LAREDEMRAARLITATFMAIVLVSTRPASAQPAGQPEAPVYFLTADSAGWLESAEKQDFLPLMAHFVSEDQATWCGIASAVMALNALGVSRPTAPQWYPYDYWDQRNIFSDKVLENVDTVSGVNGDGITLEQLETLLSLSGVRADKSFASDTDVESFRGAARAAIADPDAIVLVNFGRAALGQAAHGEGGHISPVAAYNEAADRFLILDVARYKYLPSWATAEQLFAAMNTPDSSSGKTRGYVIVRKEPS